MVCLPGESACADPMCVPKIRFCNIGDEGRRGQAGCDDAEALNRPMEWGILVQRAMNARFIIIRGIPTQDPAQVRLPQYDHVVETFPSDRADQPLDVRVLPRRSRSSRLV